MAMNTTPKLGDIAALSELETHLLKSAGPGYTRFDYGYSHIQHLWQGCSAELHVRMMERHDVMKDEIYATIWQDYRCMGLSSNGILNFQEQMIYYFPGKILSPCSSIELPKPDVIEIWKDRRNVTNFKQGRKSRIPERIVLLKLALDIRDVLMHIHRNPNDTLH